jgi:uncharacterized protein (TIGR00730 family)
MPDRTVGPHPGEREAPDGTEGSAEAPVSAPANDSLVRADRDLELLARPELRAVRLELEYLKPELTFQNLGIDHTIVVFGGTRLEDPALASAGMSEAEAMPPGVERDDRLARARGALARSRYYEVGREFGRLVGACGRGPGDNRLVVVTGGGPGGMEAANRGAHDIGAASVGLNIALPQEQKPNPYLTPGLSFEFRYFALRKLHFMLRARALVALPGGYGTLDELFEMLCLIQTKRQAPLPVILVGTDFWRRAIDFEFLLEQEMIGPDDLELFEYAESANEIWDRIQAWYAARDGSIFDARPIDAELSTAQ